MSSVAHTSRDRVRLVKTEISTPRSVRFRRGVDRTLVGQRALLVGAGCEEHIVGVGRRSAEKKKKFRQLLPGSARASYSSCCTSCCAQMRRMQRPRDARERRLFCKSLAPAVKPDERTTAKCPPTARVRTDLVRILLKGQPLRGSPRALSCGPEEAALARAPRPPKLARALWRQRRAPEHAI